MVVAADPAPKARSDASLGEIWASLDSGSVSAGNFPRADPIGSLMLSLFGTVYTVTLTTIVTGILMKMSEVFPFAGVVERLTFYVLEVNDHCFVCRTLLVGLLCGRWSLTD